ncbi:aldo/keto reductase [Candidatus Woesearchaeota archaeon]|nr:aldo/keto reductase [Candidatus Woesearchaeota archaeon]
MNNSHIEYTALGGSPLPVLGLGTWQIGGKLERSTSHDKEEIEALKTGIQLGLTHIDTAELYGEGHTEELVAQAIKQSKVPRKDLFITSKVMQQHLHYDDVLTACKKSLERLHTDYLDLYLVHFPNSQIPITETMRAMNELVENKMVRMIGASNFSVAELQEAQKYSKHKIVANQIEYSLLARDVGKYMKRMESEIIPCCEQHGIKVVAWRPLAYGLLAKEGFPVLDALAQKYGKTQGQIALNWIISKNMLVLVKATKTEHIKENIGAMSWRLSEDDIVALELGFEKWRRKYHTQ